MVRRITFLNFSALLVFNFVLISGKLLAPDSKSNINKKILNDCERCHLLVESFKYWLEKTSRGKFDGGDADWEEKKLTTYARSEVRLVEIEEGLCSELKKFKDQCYDFIEDAEQMLEIWWFDKDLSASELSTWLCVERLEHCCPESHYGPTCEPCLKDVNNNVCSGNGKCDGDGFRKGIGICLCKKGYSGKLCEQCDDNYFSSNGKCSACDRACDGCTGKGKDSCLACRSGWVLNDEGSCADVNECLEDDICKNNQFCVNIEGSYNCSECDRSCLSCIGPGASNCSSCSNDNELWNGICVDENVREHLIQSANQKVYLYVTFGIILFLIFRRSKTLASSLAVVVAVCIYILEYKMAISSFKVFFYYLFKK